MVRNWKSKAGIVIAGASMGFLAATDNPAFEWVVIFFICFLLYEVIEVYNHMRYQITVLHDRLMVLERIRREERRG